MSNEWIEYDGNGCPVPGDTVVLLRCVGEEEGEYVAHEADWDILGEVGDITHYRVATPPWSED